MVIRTNEFDTNYENYLYDTIKDAFQNKLKPLLDTPILDLTIKGFVTDEPVKFDDRLNFKLKSYKHGDSWGSLFQCGWFNLTGKIKEFNKDKDYYLKVDFSGEAALFNGGSPIKGFTNGSSVFDRVLGEPGKAYYIINDFISKDGSIDIWVEAGANDLFGNLSDNGVIKFAQIVDYNLQAQQVYNDFEALFSLLQVFSKEEPRYNELLNTLLESAFYIIYEEENFLDKAQAKFEKFYEKETTSKGKFYAVGHAHMDLAWLWPIRETKRKIGRTFANVIDHLDKHPEYVFGVSQPQMLVWIKEDYPELYERIVFYIKEGRIELQGGMWVEPDTNTTSGESLVRQLLYGIEFYKNEFDFRVKNLWLPDVFGYSGNLPQILARSGIDYFMTIKISWNLVNQFPYHTFNWKGIDGSQVLAHMPPEGTYNSPAIFGRNYEAWQKYREKDVAPKALIVYGIGDGGGGPGDEHLYRIDRQKNLDPIPAVKYSRADDFFEDLKQYGPNVPTYQGELYLENHQGTYTSQANVKMFNRLMEQKLKTVEALLTLTNKYVDHKEHIKKVWEEVLLYQFHDILPGSSIKRVYDECLARYDIISDEVSEMLAKSFTEYTNEVKNGLYLFNPLQTYGKTIIKVNDTYEVFNLEPFKMTQASKTLKGNDVNQTTFETKDLIYKFNRETGFIDEIIYKPTGKNLAYKGAINELHVYKDFGDAWNIRDHYRNQTPTMMKLVNQSVKDYNGLYEITQNYIFGKSALTQVVVIDKETNHITFEHDLDWKDLNYMLRSVSNLNILADEATFDIQYGEIKRKRTNNNSIEVAQFEVSGQEWINIFDNELGFSIINNGKYGYYVKDHILDINLLRSTNYPAEDGDIDQTNYKYQFVITDKNHYDSEIDILAKHFNAYYPAFTKPLELDSLFSVDNKNISYSTIKLAEDGDGVIIRIYETNGVKTKATLNLSDKVEKVTIVNMVEEHTSDLTDLNLTFTPFEVKTFKLYLK